MVRVVYSAKEIEYILSFYNTAETKKCGINSSFTAEPNPKLAHLVERKKLNFFVEDGQTRYTIPYTLKPQILRSSLYAEKIKKPKETKKGKFFDYFT